MNRKGNQLTHHQLRRPTLWLPTGSSRTSACYASFPSPVPFHPRFSQCYRMVDFDPSIGWLGWSSRIWCVVRSLQQEVHHLLRIAVDDSWKLSRSWCCCRPAILPVRWSILYWYRSWYSECHWVSYSVKSHAQKVDADEIPNQTSLQCRVGSSRSSWLSSRPPTADNHRWHSTGILDRVRHQLNERRPRRTVRMGMEDTSHHPGRPSHHPRDRNLVHAILSTMADEQRPRRGSLENTCKPSQPPRRSRACPDRTSRNQGRGSFRAPGVRETVPFSRQWIEQPYPTGSCAVCQHLPEQRLVQTGRYWISGYVFPAMVRYEFLPSPTPLSNLSHLSYTSLTLLPHFSHHSFNRR
jgi:hypothetical protein